MKDHYVSSDPLFLQIRKHIEDMILAGQLGADEQVPSSTQMVKFFQVNHLTVLKGMNLLVDEGIIYKKRGVGMFVSADARERIQRSRRDAFVGEFVLPLVREARRLGIARGELASIVSRAIEEDRNHDDEHHHA
ncbi:MAG: GntR family transcriptional regulator [Spirochaetaceae bacterium]|nr:MAG: GntR family transcriptional regulator [Spirochaetaceae bacterium]